jgi:hypothetical protein
MRRICCGLTLLLLSFLGVSAAATPAAAQVLDANAIRAVLRTATPEEDGFIDRVVEMVDDGELPIGVVQSTLIWAKGQPRHKFQHFRRGLITRAARFGVGADAFAGPQGGGAAPQPTPRLIDLRRVQRFVRRASNNAERFLSGVIGTITGN